MKKYLFILGLVCVGVSSCSLDTSRGDAPEVGQQLSQQGDQQYDQKLADVFHMQRLSEAFRARASGNGKDYVNLVPGRTPRWPRWPPGSLPAPGTAR